jgi:hypothetical protein
MTKDKAILLLSIVIFISILISIIAVYEVAKAQTTRELSRGFTYSRLDLKFIDVQFTRRHIITIDFLVGAENLRSRFGGGNIVNDYDVFSHHQWDLFP